MMDAATIERYVREANPVRDLDEIDPDELARSAIAVEERRRPAVHPPGEKPVGFTRSPATWRRPGWAFATAFAVIMASIGIGALVLRDESQRVDQSPEPTGPIHIESLAVGWDRVTDPLVGDIIRMCSSPFEGPFPACVISTLPNGAFYITNTSEEGTAWSPDGLSWFEGPPHGLRRDQVGDIPEPSALAGDLAVIAGGDEQSIWVGDPTTGEWESISLDVDGVEEPQILAVAASSDEALVVGKGSLIEEGAERNLVWLIDLHQGTSHRHVLPGRLIPEAEKYGLGYPVLAAWVSGNWVIAPVHDGSQFDVLVSNDAANWQQVDLPGTGAESDENTIGSLVVGELGIVAGGDLPDHVLEASNGLWFSPDGVDWEVAQPIDASPFTVTWSNVLGFVAATDGNDAALASVDGRDWHEVGTLPWTIANTSEKVLGASGGVLLSAGADGLWRWTREAAADASGQGVEAPVVDLAAPAWTSTDGLNWSRVPNGTAFAGEDVRVNDVVAGGPGLVAVGTADEAAAVWTSTDGSNWSRVPHDDATFGGAGVQVMESVTVGGPGLVAVGLRFDEPGRRGLVAAIWTSVDGLAWSPVPRDDDVFRSEPQASGNTFLWMRDVAVGGPGLVAVGSDGPCAAVWTSRDGVKWSRVPHNPSVFGKRRISDDGWGADAVMHRVVPGGPGLVAVGQAGTLAGSALDGTSTVYPPSMTAVVWTSPDGIAWSLVPHDETVSGRDGVRTINDVTAGGPGLVAVGEHASGGRERPVVWTSPDGLTWAQVPHDEEVFAGTMDRVTLGGPGLIAIGDAVWTSADGITWSRIDISGDLNVAAITIGGPGFVAVGSDP